MLTLRSVHHGVTLDGQLKWYQADRVGYGKVERHFVGFAKLCFGKQLYVGYLILD